MDQLVSTSTLTPNQKSWLSVHKAELYEKTYVLQYLIVKILAAILFTVA